MVEAPAELVERQEWLAPVETGLQKAVSAAFASAGTAGGRLRNFLHGVWLGHPLHPVLTDIPLGSWTVALVCDMMEATGRGRWARAGDVAVQVGLAGAFGAAVTGLTDWQATDGSARRVGVAHGLLNTTAAVLYTASLIRRKRRKRASARLLSTFGFAIAGAAAWLGGNLVYSKQIGVNHAAGEQIPGDWQPTIAEAELREGEMRRVMAGPVKVLLTRTGGRIGAIAETCSHLGGPLAEGFLHGQTVQCPWHGSRFNVMDGSVASGPATHPQPSLETRVREGRIEVRGRERE